MFTCSIFFHPSRWTCIHEPLSSQMAPRSQYHFRLINFLARQRKYKLGQVDTKYKVAPWGLPATGAFSPFGQDILAWRGRPQDQRRAAPRLNVFSWGGGRQQDFFPALYSLAPLISCFRLIQAGGGSTLYFSFLPLSSLHISSDTFHFIATLVFSDHCGVLSGPSFHWPSFCTSISSCSSD